MIEPSAGKLSLATGLQLNVLEWGTDDESLDHTVILVHGFLDNAWGWNSVVQAGLAGRYHLVVPDMRGHGDSDWIGRGGYYHFMDYVADLDDLVCKLGRKRVSLVGHSMGGSICSYFAGTFPDRTENLVMLEGTGPPDMGGTSPERTAFWIAAQKRARTRAGSHYPTLGDAAKRLQKADPFLDDELAMFLAEKGTRTDGDKGLVFKHDPLHMTMGPYAFQVATAGRFWKNVHCPVLLIEANRSSFRHAPEEAAKRHAMFQNHRIEVLDGAGHMMQRHQPQALADMLTRFLG